MKAGRYGDFWSKVDRRGSDECWPWRGAHDRKGYGHLNKRAHGANLAHTRAFLSSGRTLALGEVVMHTCDNPPCCNPNHLRTGTLADNNLDMHVKGRYRHLSLEQKPTAKLTWEHATRIRALAAEGVSRSMLMEQFGVDRSVICRVINNRAWVVKAKGCCAPVWECDEDGEAVTA